MVREQEGNNEQFIWSVTNWTKEVVPKRKPDTYSSMVLLTRSRDKTLWKAMMRDFE